MFHVMQFLCFILYDVAILITDLMLTTDFYIRNNITNTMTVFEYICQMKTEKTFPVIPYPVANNNNQANNRIDNVAMNQNQGDINDEQLYNNQQTDDHLPAFAGTSYPNALKLIDL